MNIPANIIAFIHLLVIIFVISLPFATDNPFVLLYYCFIVFFIMIHWHYNNDTCILTVIETQLRGKKDKDTYFGKLMKPIYNVSSIEIHYLTLFLFTFAFLKTRYWEKNRFDYMINFVVDRVSIIYDRLIK
jgi:hypothetical protein